MYVGDFMDTQNLLHQIHLKRSGTVSSLISEIAAPSLPLPIFSKFSQKAMSHSPIPIPSGFKGMNTAAVYLRASEENMAKVDYFTIYGCLSGVIISLSKRVSEYHCQRCQRQLYQVDHSKSP